MQSANLKTSRIGSGEVFFILRVGFDWLKKCLMYLHIFKRVMLKKKLGSGWISGQKETKAEKKSYLGKRHDFWKKFSRSGVEVRNFIHNFHEVVSHILIPLGHENIGKSLISLASGKLAIPAIKKGQEAHPGK